jgi:hypothetical protein
MKGDSETLHSQADSRGLLSFLKRHLFARYPMPEFMNAVRVSGFGESQEAYSDGTLQYACH